MEPDKTRYTKSPNWIHSVFAMKCPHCRMGKIFKKSWPKNYRELVDTNEHCPVCGRPIEMEVGFFYGAMYVSYILNVGIFVVGWIAFTLFYGSVFIYTWTFLSIVAVVMMVLMPYTFRLARSLWLHMFVKYKSS
ncbi:MAG TPA: DUF983 domain-containing protein [Flavobacteriales bacterium]|nr:DUF983 domain-containing protein [Flavobacteriales bacterium]